MSYVIHIWNNQHFRPTSLAEAEDALSRLREERLTMPDPAFGALVGQVNKAFGIEFEADLGRIWIEPPEPVWQPLLTLGIVIDELPLVVPAVIAAARSLGLVVYDGQAGEVMLPDSGGYDTSGPLSASYWASAVKVPELELTQTTGLKALAVHLDPVFRSYGFKPARGEWWYRKKTKDLKINVSARIHWDFFRFWIYVELMGPRSHPDLARACGKTVGLDVHFERLAQRSALPLTAYSPDRRYAHPRDPGNEEQAHEWPAKTWEQIETIGQELHPLLTSDAMRFLGDLNTVSDLDKLANCVPDEDCPFYHHRNRTVANGLLHLNCHQDLIAAYLANNPNFESLARGRYEACRAGNVISNRVADNLRDLYALMGLTV